MRINRQKKLNKYLSFYCNNYGFRKPYQILVDGTFCQEALKCKVNIQDQLPKYFGGDIKLLTTQCVILETEKLGPAVYGAMLIVKQFVVHKCGHEGNPVPAYLCLKNMISHGNPNRYIIATQDSDLQRFSMKVKGAPFLSLSNKAPTLSKPSFITYQSAMTSQRKSCLTVEEKKSLKTLKKEVIGDIPKPTARPFKRKKKGGPNPLSCKKKQKKQPENKQKKNPSK